ncbi:MAG: hypothetical protein ACP5RR_00495 [Candidatus Kapaibacteriota bacterium]
MYFFFFYKCLVSEGRADYFKTLRLPKTRALKIVLFKHYVTDAPI